jgi:glyoxylase-like metal-dependent hydrolase (beta-lactamase superfamily II)
MQAVDDHDRKARLTSAERLRELALDDDVMIFCAHDPVELDAVAEAIPAGQAPGRQAGRQARA